MTNDLRDLPIAEPAGVVQQATNQGWKAGIFDFGRAKTDAIDYFNATIVTRPDGDWLITRRCAQHDRIKVGMNDLFAFQLNGKIPVRGMKVKVSNTAQEEQFEDPRAIFHNGHTWIGACNFTVDANRQVWSGGHQVLLETNGDWNVVRRHDVGYGKNGRGLGKNTGVEKNWLWFFHEGNPHLIYLSQPHTVIAFDPNFENPQEYITGTHLQWAYGEIRGGTPPILMDGLYWTFFHSSLPWTHSKRRYFMGALAFEPKPPFRIMLNTAKPLLIGSWRDRWRAGCPLVVFPNGALLRDGLWTVVGGVNDLDSFWCELPHLHLRILVEKAATK